MCDKCMMADTYIGKFWTERPWKHSKYGQTYKRRSPIDDHVEFIAKAGENASAHTDNPQYYEKRHEEGSVLGVESLHLNMVCWMNPWATVEGIKNAKSISLYIYHSYGNSFNMSNHVYISLADVDDAENFARVKEVSWPLENAHEQPRNLIIREKIADFDVPEHLQDKKLLCRVEIFGEGDWK